MDTGIPAAAERRQPSAVESVANYAQITFVVIDHQQCVDHTRNPTHHRENQIQQAQQRFTAQQNGHRGHQETQEISHF